MRLSGEFIIIFFMKRLIHANKTLSRSTTREATRIYQFYKYKSLIISLVVKGRFDETSKSLKIL